MLVTDIYVLKDPRDGAIRYVGKSVDSARRYKRHIYEARKGRHDSARMRWLRELLEAGYEPIMEVVETVEGNGWPERERWWMEKFLDDGCDLTNTAPAGGGWIPGLKISEATRRRRSEALAGRTISPETRAKISESCKGRVPWNKGKPRREGVKQEHSARMKAKADDSEWRRKMEENVWGPRRGKKLAREHRQKISNAQTGREVSEETRRKLSEAATKRWREGGKEAFGK